MAKHLTAYGLMLLNVAGVIVGFAGLDLLKMAEWPPFDDGHTLFGDALGLCSWPPIWVVRLWASKSGACAVCFLAILSWLFAAKRWKGPVVNNLFWPALALGCALTGLMGLWIWTHACLNAGMGLN